MDKPTIPPDGFKVVEVPPEFDLKARPNPQLVTPDAVVHVPDAMVPITGVISTTTSTPAGVCAGMWVSVERAIDALLAGGVDSLNTWRANGETKSMKLYHFTSKDVVPDILQSGFKPGPDGTVWFAEHPTVIWGNESSEVLMEIVAPIGVVTPHKRQVEEEDLDPSTGEFVPSAEAEIGHYYALPQEVANRYKPRRVPDEERRLMTI